MSSLQVSQNINVFSAYKMYRLTLSDIVEKHAPLQHKDIVIRPDTPWYNDSIASAKRKRRQTERRWRVTKSDSDRVLYRKQCDAVNELVDLTKRAYYNEKIHECGSDQKALFHIIKRLLHNEKATSLPTHNSLLELSDRFSYHFMEKINVIRSDLLCYSSSVILPNVAEMSTTKVTEFRSCTDDEVIQILSARPNSKSKRLHTRADTSHCHNCKLFITIKSIPLRHEKCNCENTDKKCHN